MERLDDVTNPAQSGDRRTTTQDQPKEGDYRNVETGVNKPENFDDDYEVEQEDEISEQEAGEENYGKPGKQ